MELYKITLEEVITFKHYFEALKNCNKAVNYKFSVQEYNANCIERITDTINCILSGGIPKIKNNTQVTIRERGKARLITPIDIADRITQKVLCDYVLIPSIVPHLIYDNGASLKGKGTQFARERFNLFLEIAKKIGDMNALVFDVKGYFSSISHKECERILNKYIWDKRIVRLCMGIIRSYEQYKDGTGICLGSQISQVMAVAVLNDFDHFVKDKLSMKFYLRYMDDGVIIYHDKSFLQSVKHQIIDKAAEHGFILHPQKTRVVSMKKGIVFLKIRYQIRGMTTLKRLTRAGIVRERRRLKKLKPKLKAGRIPFDTIEQSLQSWLAHAKIAKCDRTKKEIKGLYRELYGKEIGYDLLSGSCK